MNNRAIIKDHCPMGVDSVASRRMEIIATVTTHLGRKETLVMWVTCATLALLPMPVKSIHDFKLRFLAS